MEDGMEKFERQKCCRGLLTDHELSVAVVPTKDPHEIGSVNMLS